MKVDLKDIQYRYRQMSDAELRAIRPNQLTPVGLRCYLDEISSRGFETNQTPSLFDEQLFERAKALGEKMRREVDAQSPPLQSRSQVAIEEIAALYERMTDEELLRLRPKDLTSEALGRYMKEASRRGLSIELPPAPPLAPPLDEDQEVEALLAGARIWKERYHYPSLEGHQHHIAHALVALVAFLVFLSKRRSWSGVHRHPVLWLRRFHSAHEDRAFKSLLAEACSGLATVVTIQDDTVSYSWGRGFERFSWLFVSLLGVVVIANFFPFDKAFFAYEIVFPVLAVVALCVFLFRGLGVTKISDERPAEQITEIIQGIKKGAKVASRDPLVVKCTEQSWQNTVATAEALCDAVVMDVADLSTNMEWELATAIRLKPSKSVILVCGIEYDASEELQSLIVARMDARMAKLRAGGMDNCPVFFFPMNVDRSDGTERLQRLLAEAIVRKKRIERL